MLLLYVLFGTYFVALVASRIIKGEFKTRVAGRMGMSGVLVLTGIGHFLYPIGMAKMLPDFVPFPVEIIYITGVMEFAAAIGLLVHKTQRITTWLLIAFLVIILPCNIYSAIHHINYTTGNLDGQGLDYLWFRIPLQLFLIGWAYYFGIYVDRPKPHVVMTRHSHN